MKNILKVMAVAGAGAALLAGCGKSNEWTLKGDITPSGEGCYVVEAFDNGRWYPLDSLRLDKSGKFSYSHAAHGYPDIYRVTDGKSSIYFPIDSIETVTLHASGESFGVDYQLSGSPQAAAMMRVDSIINSAVAAGPDAIFTDTRTKRELGKEILADPSSIVAYYIINRRIGGRLIFDPVDKTDLRIVGAVANAYNTLRPSDPRSAYLKKLFLDSRRVVHPRDSITAIYANQVLSPEIKLYDENGTMQSLNELASKGGVVLLNFTMYGAQDSPAFNVMLNSLYEKYHSAGMEIFQVAIDDDEYLWKQTASNLPWITVLNDAADSDRVILDYNVGSIPTIFILDRTGAVVERITQLDDLEPALRKYL